MPELPEVQTVLSTLERQIKNKKIKDIDILYRNIIDGDVKSFKNRLIGQHFRSFKRRGKYLLFEMDDVTLVSHLRMEGKYFIQCKDEEIKKHTHVIFTLDNNKQLRYNDVRKFGRMELISKDKDYKDFKDLGPEPFSKDFNLKYCNNFVKNYNHPAKELLLNQSFVAGIGNIYADEILYACKIHPLTKSILLSDNDFKNIIKYTRLILSKAIKAGGTTIRSYTSSLGVTGKFQLSLNCHTMKKCKKCKSNIKKIRVGGRGTYYCPKCQKEKVLIGITGTIGSGKTEVLNYIKSLKYPTFSCDEYNSKLLKNKNVIKLIKKEFKDVVINNKIDKQKLAEVVFSNKSKRRKLESILHPLIIDKMIQELDKKGLLFAEVPLLFEAHLKDYFTKIILITSSNKIALYRLKNRGIDKAEANRRINSQMSFKDKTKGSDIIIYNNGSLFELKTNVKKALKDIC